MDSERHYRHHFSAITASNYVHKQHIQVPISAKTTTNDKPPPPLSSSTSTQKLKLQLKSAHVSATSAFSSSALLDDIDTDDMGEKPSKKRRLEDVAFAADAAAAAASSAAASAGTTAHAPPPNTTTGSGLMTPQISSDTPPNSNSKDKAITELEPSAHHPNDRSENVVLSTRTLEGVLDRLQKKDTYGVFSEPVDPEEVPDYYDFIKFPMDFGTMRKKITDGAYASLELFQKDIFLICSNAMHYNARDTVYYRQARAIQEAARKILEALKAGIPFEVDQKSQPSLVKKLSCKRPPTGKSRFELAGSDYTSGATLATCERATWMNHEVAKGGKVVHVDRPAVTAACIPQGQASSRLCISGSVNGSAGSPMNGRLDSQDDLSGLSMKCMAIRDGKKVQPYDENHRNSYRPHDSLVCGGGPSWTSFGGELQQLIPMGYQQDYAYARSLARFAADLGPAIWKIAAEKIRKALPPGVPFGPGWVVDPSPVVFPVLAKAQSSSMLPSESRASTKSAPGLQVGGVGRSNECMGDTSANKTQNAIIPASQLSLPAERLAHVPQLVSKSLPPSQLNCQGPMKLSFRGANLAAEVSQSKLLEMVSQNGRLVSWTSDKPMDQGATVCHSSGSVANHCLLERMLDVNVGRTTHESASFENNSKSSSDNSGLDFSTHAGGQSQAGWATQSVSSRFPCMQNPTFFNSGGERQQAVLMNPDTTPAAQSTVFSSVVENSSTSMAAREDSRMPGGFYRQPVDSSHWGTRLKFQNQLQGSVLASQLLATAQYATQYQETQEYILQQREFQVRLAASQRENNRMSTSVPQFRHHQFPCDVSPHAQQHLAQMHQYTSAKGVPLGSALPCDSRDSSHLSLHSSFSAPIVAGTNSVTNQSWGFIPMQYPMQQASNSSHSLPPDLNVSVPAPKSSLDQASSNLSDSQQPDLALQL